MAEIETGGEWPLEMQKAFGRPPRLPRDMEVQMRLRKAPH